MQIRYFSAREIANMTGRSVYTVWRWCRSGKLPASCPGGRDYLIAEPDFEAFMASNARERKNREGAEA